ncbi:hypothetical protein [Ekhidna sp.]|uniref:hypothetical protein n=1 Tax=Ekhidna sp. TaxID=2608089 RepID=UPI003297B8B9
MKKATHSIEVDLLISDSTKNLKSVDFQSITKKNGSTFSIDENYGIARIDWNDHVDIHTAKKLIRSAFEAIEFHGCNKLVLDHSFLVEFETEARVWVKELLKHKAESLSNKLVKLASISPISAIGSMYSSFAGEILKDEIPLLKMKRFDDVQAALNWLI